MKVLLIYPRSPIWNLPTQIPLGLAYLAAVLLKSGYEVEVFDLNVEEKSLNSKLKNGNFDLVGISATTPLIKNAWSLAKIVKEKTKAWVVLGGPHPSALPEESLKQPGVDIVIRGEGEETILDVCLMILKKKKINEILGISYNQKTNRQIKIIHNPSRPLIENLNRLPLPAYELFKLDRYSNTQPLKDRFKKGSRAFYLMTSRGCPYGCLYCFKGVCGRTWRPFSPKRVIEEWEHLVLDLKATEIGIQDDVFNLEKKRAIEICDLLIEHKLNHIPWITNNGIRADKVDLELLQKMKAAGCKRVAFGVESGNQKILDQIQKNLTLGQIRKAFKLAKKVGLETMGFFMFGNAGENEKTMEQTIKFALELNPEIAHFSIATPFPGSPLFELVKSQGQLHCKDWNQFGILEGKGFFSLKQVTPELVEKKWLKAYRSFYLRPERILKEFINLNNWLNYKLLLKAGKNYFFKNIKD